MPAAKPLFIACAASTFMWSIDEHTDAQHEYDMLTPTVPEWSSDEDAPAQEVEVRPPMIQCTVHPENVTNNGIWMLAIMGAVTVITIMVTTVTMMRIIGSTRL